MPLLPFAWIVLGVSLTLFSIELVNTDLQSALQLPFWWALTYSASLAVLAALALVAIRNRKVLFVIAPAIALLISVTPKIVSSFQLNKMLMGPGFEYVRWRLAMGGGLAIAAAMTGYVIFFLFMGVQGVRHVRVRTELELAEKDSAKGLKLAEIARLRERVQAVVDRAAWVPDAAHRGHLLSRAGTLLEKLA